ncbi:MAG: hypothetical protein WCC69_06145 [Pirellulales bacterium]
MMAPRGSALTTWAVWAAVARAMSLAATVSLTGCGARPAPAVSAPANDPASGTVRSAAPAATSAAARQKLLAGALAVLDRFDDFDEARGAELVFDRLAQWSRVAAEPAGGSWRPDPLLDTLPDRLRAAVPEPLDAIGFAAAHDVTFLRDERWLADIARVARGGAVDDVAIATNLFQWTVRSLALVSDPPLVPSETNPGNRWFLPGEILLAGRASAPQRAWIFLELLRHAGLTGVMLATCDAADGDVRPWVPAVMSDGEMYLFEPAYGIPIAGPEGRGVATVSEAAGDPAILETLSLPDRPYRVQAADMQRLSVLVATDAWTSSRRMAILDTDLRSTREMRIAVAASAAADAARTALPEAARERPAGVWEFPWETVARRRAAGAAVSAAAMRELAPLQIALVPTDNAGAGRPMRPLYAARLREFRGELDGPTGAKAAYLAARPGRDVIAAAVRGLPPEQAQAAGRLYGQMKEDAAYWLGVLTLGEGEYEAAVDYLRRMTLEAAPDSRWADAAQVNLGQAYLGLGKTAEAVAALRADRSPQRFGSRLLADQLEKRRPVTP